MSGFLSTPSARRATDLIVGHNIHFDVFLSTPSARRATRPLMATRLPFWISIHALREEGDDVQNAYKVFIDKFLSTPSARRATKAQVMELEKLTNFYPRPPRGGRPCARFVRACACTYFYPRPPRGGRHSRNYTGRRTKQISIHALREEGDHAIYYGLSIPDLFLSTPSARRATAGRCLLIITARYFYPRPPRGGRPKMTVRGQAEPDISIHALREEGDLAGGMGQ